VPSAHSDTLPEAPIAWAARRYPCAETIIDPDSWRMPVRSADTFLHATLEAMAVKLHLTRPDGSPL
jgi:hypothetical protein